MDEKLEYFKKKILAHLDDLEQKENAEKKELKKSLLAFEMTSIEKAGYPVGTIREWKGKKYIKVAPGKWKPKYDSHSRGAKMAIAALKKKIDACTDSEELMQIILENRDRFSDENGRPLPFVKELSDYISGRNDTIESEKNEKKATDEKIKNHFAEKEQGDKETSVFSNKDLSDRVNKGKKLIDEYLEKYLGDKNISQNLLDLYAVGDAKRYVSVNYNSTFYKNLSKEQKKQASKFNEKLEQVLEEYASKRLAEKQNNTSEAETKQSKQKEEPKNIEFTLDDIRHIGDGKETKKVNDMETAKNVIKQIAEKYGATEKGRKELSDFIALNIGGSNPLYDKIYEEFNISYEDLDMDSDACHDLMLNQSLGKNTKKQREQISDSKSEFEDNYRQMLENEDKRFNEENKKSNKKQTLDTIRDKYKKAKSVTGNRKTIHVGDEKIKCHYKLVEADTPTASHDETTFRKTEGFPTVNGGSVNDNDYENSPEAKESVYRIAGNYDGRAIEDPPILTKDGIVVSGNNRTMSSKLAAKKGTDKEYIKELAETIEDYGIDEDELKNFKNPRLVLEIDEEHKGDYTTEEFAKYNRNGKKEKSVTEKAVVIAKTVKPQAIESIAKKISEFDTLGDLYNDRKATQDLVNTFIQNDIIQENEVAQYYDNNGLSANGKEFIETVLVGSIMNENNIRSLAGDGGKALRQKLVRGIVPLIENKGHGNEYSFNNELNKAVEIAAYVSKNHNTFPTISVYLNQNDMFEEKPSELTQRLAEIVHDSTQKQFAEQMKEAEGGIRPNAQGEMDIFLGECESRDSVLERILQYGKNAIKKAVAEVLAMIA